MFLDRETGEMRNELAEVRYSHKAMIELILANPGIHQRELATFFGRTESWISIVMRSDAFQAALDARRTEVYDPILAPLRAKFEAAASMALDRVLERLEGGAPDKFVLETAKLAAGALGYGASGGGAGSSPAVSVVIQVPQKAASEAAWAERYDPTRRAEAGGVVDVPSREVHGTPEAKNGKEGGK